MKRSRTEFGVCCCRWSLNRTIKQTWNAVDAHPINKESLADSRLRGGGGLLLPDLQLCNCALMASVFKSFALTQIAQQTLACMSWTRLLRLQLLFTESGKKKKTDLLIPPSRMWRVFQYWKLKIYGSMTRKVTLRHLLGEFVNWIINEKTVDWGRSSSQ